MSKIGVLLIQLGTPDSSHPKAVYRYLTEFLNDPRVIDLPALLRWILTNLFIVPFRYKKTTLAYQKIITGDGLPLLTFSRKLQQAIAIELGDQYHVELGMRYGNPTIQSALKNLKNCNRIIAIPLFPQYSSAATGSAISKLLYELAKQKNIPEIKIIRDFYNDAGFIQAYADIIQQTLHHKKIDILLFSYHGLPEYHLDKNSCLAACDRLHACPSITDQNCYRAQCYETSRLLAAALNLKETEYQTAFQSRLGRTPWIKPYTDTALIELRQQGVKNLAIACPSFVTDCLETLEEINIRAREQWQRKGGDEFIFIPCLNDQALWVKAIANIIRK